MLKGNAKTGRELLVALRKDAKHLFDLPIGSHDVPVYESAMVGDMECWGLAICHPDYAIFLDPNVPKHQKRRTLLHEALEVINDIFDLGQDERGIRILENALWQILRKQKL